MTEVCLQVTRMWTATRSEANPSIQAAGRLGLPLLIYLPDRASRARYLSLMAIDRKKKEKRGEGSGRSAVAPAVTSIGSGTGIFYVAGPSGIDGCILVTPERMLS